MFNAKQLSDDQKEALRQRAAAGGTLADLQRLLKDEYDLSVTFMDTRFLVLDLGIEIVEETKEPEKLPDEVIVPPEPTGVVSVTMDHITLPGAMVSGKVSFSDGEQAIWMLDQSGRPGLDPDTPGYRPSQEDIAEFQNQLRVLLEKSGF